MTDFTNALRQAAEHASAQTVAPPFARIERRRAQRRTTQLAFASVAVVAAGGLAVAAPRALRDDAVGPASPGNLKPFDQIARDYEAQVAIDECMRREGEVPPGEPIEQTRKRQRSAWQRCLAASGYQTDEMSVDPGGEPTSYRMGCDAALSGEWSTLNGRWRGDLWALVATEEDAGQLCLRVAYRGTTRDVTEGRGNVRDQVTPLGADAVLVHGWVAPYVARVEVTSGGRTYTATTEFLDGAPLHVYAVAVPGQGRDVTVTYRRADGTAVGAPRRVATG